MVFKVKITKKAEKDINDAITYISLDSPSQAQKWFEELKQAILSLQTFPYRFASIPESEEIGSNLRDFLFYSHRVIYLIDESIHTVFVVRIYHRAIKPFAGS